MAFPYISALNFSRNDSKLAQYLPKFRCALTLHSIFAHEDSDVASVYIQSLSPRVLEYLLDDASRTVSDETELLFTIECVKLLEVMVRAQDEPEKRRQLMEFLLPILVSHLGWCFFIRKCVIGNVTKFLKRK